MVIAKYGILECSTVLNWVNKYNSHRELKGQYSWIWETVSKSKWNDWIYPNESDQSHEQWNKSKLNVKLKDWLCFHVEIQKTITNVLNVVLDCRAHCSNRKTGIQMMYDFCIMLSVKSLHCLRWGWFYLAVLSKVVSSLVQAFFHFDNN